MSICTKTDHGGRGWLGEVGIGYDYQITDKIVIGALFDYDFSDINGQLEEGGVSGKTNNDFNLVCWCPRRLADDAGCSQLLERWLHANALRRYELSS